MDRKFIEKETFQETFPFKPNFKRINNFNMHYIDEGSGEPIVCLHGMPTWGYLYRNFINILSKNNHIIVPDHMGFGKSDVPQDKQYLLRQHVDNLNKLMISLNLENITLIVQDWGGPIGFGFAVNYPEKIKRLVIMNTSVGVMKEDAKPWYYALEKQGKYEEFIKNIPGLIKMGIFKKNVITDIMIKAYTAPFPTDKYFIGALAWPKDIPIGNTHPSAEIMKNIRNKLNVLSNKQKILIWGLKDPVFPESLINWWIKIYPDLKVYRLEQASHFLQEDNPYEIINIISGFLKIN